MIKDDCRTCRFHCKHKDWFSYGEIRFCCTQMIFLIEHIAELGEGGWPDNPDSSSYVDLLITSRSVRDEAYFAKPAGFVAEVMSRLNKTGEGGITLLEEIHSGLRERQLLSSVARKALNYISGWRRRKEAYKDWKSRTRKSQFFALT